MKPDEGLQWLGRLFFFRLGFHLTGAVGCDMTRLIALPAMSWLGVIGEDILTKDTEMRFVSCNSQHNQVGIETVDDVPTDVSVRSALQQASRAAKAELKQQGDRTGVLTLYSGHGLANCAATGQSS